VRALINPENLVMPKFEDNEAGITLKSDGSFIVWSTFKDPANPTEQQVTQVNSLRAFAAALQCPPIMDVLYQLADDKTLFPQDINAGTPH
jgi:hypothetical protein